MLTSTSLGPQSGVSPITDSRVASNAWEFRIWDNPQVAGSAAHTRGFALGIHAIEPAGLAPEIEVTLVSLEA